MMIPFLQLDQNKVCPQLPSKQRGEEVKKEGGNQESEFGRVSA